MSVRPSSRATTTLSAALLVAIGTLFVAQQFSVAAPTDEETSKLVAQMVPRYHLNQVRIDDDLSKHLFAKYFKDLDPQKLYFLKADIEAFQTFQTALDDGVKTGDVEFAYAVFDTYRKRVDERLVLAEEMLDGEFDFTLDDSIHRDADDIDWAASEDELRQRWHRRVKYDILQLKLADEPMEEILDRLHKRYRNLKLNIDQTEPMDVLEIYLSTMLACFDPHSSYMSPNTLEDFQISMRLSLDGIGAALRSEDGYTIVAEIVPGGAADKDGRLKVGDKVIGVGQEEGEVEDIVDLKLTKVVRKIRGPRGTKVRLQVKPEAGEAQVYELVRQKIELKESEVKGEIIESGDRIDRPGRIGVLTIPAFYRDFAGASAGGEFKSASRDVAEVLRDFHRQGGVDGLIIDLRGNGGGALTEAIEISGHFIDKGPVVQVKATDGSVISHNDEEAGVLYSGPLVVICNRASASASEIFAGVIKDYNRGIVIGDTTTHGKGTVQNVMPVAPNSMLQIFNTPQRGALKLTIQQFYRVNGDSTQNRGVPSDVVLPSVFDHWDIGEAFLDNALPFDRIPEATHASVLQADKQIRSDLQAASAERVAGNEDFQKIQEAVRRYLERKSQKSISLNEEQMRKEREEDEKLAKTVDALQTDGEVVDPDSDAAPQTDETSPGADKKEDEAFPQNFYNDEVLQITVDYLGKLRELRTVQR
jgi:carboxyl-terminal processing protease